MNLKYLKLFEAFESSTLKKTLGYINKESKGKFIENLKSLCGKFDFPLDKLSDDIFQYKAFNTALKIYKEVDSSNNEIKLVKFWFSKEGDFVNTTVVTGEIKSTNTSFDRNVDAYNVVREISHRDLDSLPEGSIILFKRYRGEDGIVSYLYKPEGEGRDYYLLQDEYSGSYPERNRDWEEISNYSWCIDNSDDYFTMTLIDPINKNTGDTDVYNHNIVIDDNGRIKNSCIKREELSNADFALILDIDKLKSKDYEKVSKKVSNRVITKSGAFLTDDEIKKTNLDRYINAIILKEFDIKKVSSIVKRIVGYNSILFLLSDNNSVIEYLCDEYFNLLRNDNDYSKDRLEKYIKEKMKKSFNDRSLVENNIKKLKEFYTKSGDEDLVKLLEDLEVLSKLIYDRFFTNDLESIYDLEVLNSKLETLNNYMSSSKNGFERIKQYFLKHTKDYSSAETCLSSRPYNPDPEEVINFSIPRLKELVSRL